MGGAVWMGTALNKFDLIGCVFYWAGTAPGGTAWGTAFPNIRTVWSEVSNTSYRTDNAEFQVTEFGNDIREIENYEERISLLRNYLRRTHCGLCRWRLC